MTNRVQWKRFSFFEKDVLSENIQILMVVYPFDLLHPPIIIFTLPLQSGKITCALAEGGILVFGDATGVVLMVDRNMNVIWKQKLFKGSVGGVHYIYDVAGDIRKQFIIAIGDDVLKPSSSPNEPTSPGPHYLIKVSVEI